MFKQLSSPLQLCVTIPLDELCKISYPNVFDVRIHEHLDASLINLERIFKILILLEDESVVEYLPD